MRCLTLWATFVGAWVALAAPLRADGLVLDGISARSLSRGGTNIGFADNGAVIHDNPAAMVNIDSCNLVEFGAIGLFSNFEYSDPDNTGGVSSHQFTPLPNFSYITKSPDQMWAFGLGIFPEAGFAENYTMQGPGPFFGGPQHYKSFGALCKILPGVSCRLTDCLTVGGTFGLAYSQADLEGPYTLQGPSIFAGTPTLMDLHGTDVTYVWSVGLQYEVMPGTTIGATYLSPTRAKLDGTTSVTLPGLGTATYESRLDIEWPETFGVGVRQQLGPCQTIAADVLWLNWSGAFDDFQLRLRRPSTPGFPEVNETIPLNWRDSVSVRLGYECALCNGTFRMGYVYHRDPIPSGTLTPFIQATLQHSLSVGYGWCWGDWNVDAGYMYLFGPNQHVADSQLLGGDFDNSTHDANVHAIFLGLQKRF